jgi:hypothetical protein
VSCTKLHTAPPPLLPPSKLRHDAALTQPPFARASQQVHHHPPLLHREKLLFHATFLRDFDVFPITVVFLAQVAAGYAPSPPGLRGPRAWVALSFVKLNIRTPSGFINCSELPTPLEIPVSAPPSPAPARLPHHRPTPIREPP